MENSILISNLIVKYENKIAIEIEKLEIPKNVRCCIVGPNGAGKTTLLKTILNLLNQNSGTIKIFNKNYNEIKEKIAYIPQRKSIDWNFPITVYDVVLMGAYDISKSFFSKIPDYAHQITIEKLKMLDIIKIKDFHINDISGGQQQRVFIARAMAQQYADLYILDEPLTGVDYVSEKKIAEIFFSLQRENKTIVSVHHDINTINEYFDYIVALNKKLIYSGPYKKDNFKEIIKEAFWEE